MNWRPLRGRVVIRPDEAKQGMIIIPDTIMAEENKRRNIARTGVVVAMGTSVVDNPGYSVGDRVVYIYGNINEPWGEEKNTAWCAEFEVLGVVT